MACSSVTTVIPTSGRLMSLPLSIGLRQTEDVLGHVAEDHVGGDGRYLVQTCLTELALDVVLAGKAESPMGLQAGIGGFPAGLGGQMLGHVGLRTGVKVRIDLLAGLPAHKICRLKLNIGLCDRELHALVLADLAIEDDALVRVLSGPVDEPVTITDAFGRYQ